MCSKEEASELFKYLMENNSDISVLKAYIPYIDINEGNNEYTNLLISACCKKNLNNVKFLVENCVDVNKLSDNDTTPIMYSLEKGDFDTFIYLYNNGALLKPKGAKTIGQFSPKNEYMTEFLEKMIVFLQNNKHT